MLISMNNGVWLGWYFPELPCRSCWSNSITMACILFQQNSAWGPRFRFTRDWISARRAGWRKLVGCMASVNTGLWQHHHTCNWELEILRRTAHETSLGGKPSGYYVCVLDEDPSFWPSSSSSESGNICVQGKHQFGGREICTGRLLKQVGAGPSPNRKTLHNNTVLTASTRDKRWTHYTKRQF